MKKILLLAISLSIVFTTSCKWFRKSGMSDEQVKVLLMQKQELEKRLKADSANYSRELETLRTEYEQKIAQYEAKNKKPVKGFYVVVGSFKNSGYAENFSQNLKSIGYNVSIIPGPNDFNCVITGNYSRLKDALPELAKVRSGITPEAWIYFK